MAAGQDRGALPGSVLGRTRRLRARGRPLTDVDPPPGDAPAELEDGHEDVVGLALASAEVDAKARDFPGALRWLEVAEDLGSTSPASTSSSARSGET